MQALKSGPIKYVGAGSNLKLDANGVDQSSTFKLNEIRNGVLTPISDVADA